VTRLAAAVTAGLVAFALASPAGAQAPANDNYLDSIPINAPGSALTQNQYFDSQDTTFATVQDDLFGPGGGGGPEFTVCNNAFRYGKTVWYDFYPHVNGSVRILTTGFDTVVGVVPFAYPPAASFPVTNEWFCYDDPSPTTLEEVSFPVTGGRAYTLQIGGYAEPLPGDPANADFGALEFRFNYFPDRDGDGVLDNVDQCQTTPGSQANGCPPPPPPPDSDGDTFPNSQDCKPFDPKIHPGAPEVRGNKVDENCDKKLAPFRRIQPAPVLHGIAGSTFTFRDVTVGNVPVGAAVKVTCKRGKRSCGSAFKVRRKRAGSVVLRGLRKTIQPGSKITVLVTKRDWIGFITRYTIRSNKGPRRFDHCVNVGRSKPPPGKCKSTQ
jgi:hypothetical protein